MYADHLIANLMPLMREGDSMILVIQGDDIRIAEAVKGNANVDVVKIPSRIFRNRALLLGFEQLVLPVIALLGHADLIHSLHYTHPLLAFTRRVVTIHDLTFVLFPELHTRGRRLIMPFFIRRAIKHAEAVIFVSSATQKDAERLFPASHNMKSVIPLGVEPVLANVEKDDQAILSELGLERPFLLFIGTLEPRKNIVRIVHAFERIADRHPEITFILAGKLGWHTDEIVSAIEQSPTRFRIHLLGFIDAQQKAALLRSCLMLVYPSLYEGFGLPVLEAMAVGAPVITSNLSSMPEVAGDAALLVDPTSVEQLVDAMEHIIRNAVLAKQLSDAGPTQASLFTWDRAARLTLSLYRDVVQRRS